MRRSPWLAAVGIVFMAARAHAGLDPLPLVHPLFCDHMVLQRDRADPIWGWASPGAAITVTFNGRSTVATVDASGKWQTTIGPYPAGGPSTLTIDGPKHVEIKDVLLGDVWISAGQSNMEYNLGGEANAKAELADTTYPQMRLFHVNHFMYIAPQPVTRSAWTVSSPATAAGFSAVSYLFGRNLHKELGVPIGMIDASLGSTICEAWTSTDALAQLNKEHPNANIFGVWLLDKALDLAKREPEITQQYKSAYDGWWNQDAGIQPANDWSQPTTDTTTWKPLAKLSVIPVSECKAGLVWFKKTVDLPEYFRGKDLDVHLGCFRGDDTLWINGQIFSRSDGWHNYHVGRELTKDGKLQITIRNWNTDIYSDHTVGCWNNVGTVNVAGEWVKTLSIGDDWRYVVAINGEKKPCPPEFIKVETNDVAGAFNGMLHPLIPFGIKGAIWYQGEFNAGNPGGYRELLPNMIRDWRTRFGQGDFPFYIVQLPNFGKPQADPNGQLDWADMRSTQYQIAQAVPNTGIAISIDTSSDGNLHPREKAAIAHRLALVALEKTYGKSLDSSGPVFHAAKAEGAKLRVTFDHADGLVSKGDTIKGFAIAGEDKHFVWADAAIEGAAVVLSSPSVATPKFVRYAWGSNPACSLYNKAGLPAVPFRTDR